MLSLYLTAGTTSHCDIHIVPAPGTVHVAGTPQAPTAFQGSMAPGEIAAVLPWGRIACGLIPLHPCSRTVQNFLFCRVPCMSLQLWAVKPWHTHLRRQVAPRAPSPWDLLPQWELSCARWALLPGTHLQSVFWKFLFLWMQSSHIWKLSSHPVPSTEVLLLITNNVKLKLRILHFPCTQSLIAHKVLLMSHLISPLQNRHHKGS